MSFAVYCHSGIGGKWMCHECVFFFILVLLLFTSHRGAAVYKAWCEYYPKYLIDKLNLLDNLVICCCKKYQNPGPAIYSICSARCETQTQNTLSRQSELRENLSVCRHDSENLWQAGRRASGWRPQQKVWMNNWSQEIKLVSLWPCHAKHFHTRVFIHIVGGKQDMHI